MWLKSRFQSPRRIHPLLVGAVVMVLTTMLSAVGSEILDDYKCTFENYEPQCMCPPQNHHPGQTQNDRCDAAVPLLDNHCAFATECGPSDGDQCEDFG